MAEEHEPLDEQDEGEAPIMPVAPEVDLADEEGFPASELPEPPPMKPVFPHTSETVYWYDGATSTRHDVLLEIQPGENRWPDADDATIDALQACVEAGVLTVGIPEEIEESEVEEDEPAYDDEDDAHEDEPA